MSKCVTCGKLGHCYNVWNNHSLEYERHCHECYLKMEEAPDHTQFREDVRACLTYLMGDPEAAKREWSVVIACAVAGAEEIERQLKERGRL